MVRAMTFQKNIPESVKLIFFITSLRKQTGVD